MAELTPANENPWYVLMTLYGEQEGERVDTDLAEKNRRVWNAWSCQGLNDEERERACVVSKIEVAETKGWVKMGEEIRVLHRSVMEFRNSKNPHYSYAGFLDFNEKIRIYGVKFLHPVVCSQFIFAQVADFSSATFSDGSTFSSAAFMQEAMFFHVLFASRSNFESATFEISTSFSSATFLDDGNFTKASFAHAEFSSATFKQKAKFNSSKFTGEVSFSSATFWQIANFNSVAFSEYAHFDYATFRQLADFTSAKFMKVANFGFAQFDDRVFFH